MYAISEDGEFYSGSYETKEEAIKAGCKEFEEYTNFYVGEMIEPKVTPGSFDGDKLADTALDLIQDQLDEIGGEFAENFSVSSEDEATLSEYLENAVRAWIEARDIKPGFFLIENDEKIHIPDFLRETIQ